MTRAILTTIILITINLSAWAQGTISGNVADENGDAVPFANVILLQNDSIIITGTITDENGKFTFTEVPNANTIKISCIGFTDYVKKLSENEHFINAVLEESDISLSEIVVTGRRQLTQIKNGAMVTTVENTLLSKEGSAEDVLTKMPGVMKKGSDIEVFGRGTPEIYINSRKVQSKDELSQLNSENIKNVQVIRNPGAKYSAETKAVIIITTKDNVGEGFSFDVKNKHIAGHYYSTENQLNLNYRKNKLDIFTNFSMDYSKEKGGPNYQQTTFTETIWKFNTKDNNSFSDSYEYMAKGGFNYQFNENHSLGAFYQYDADDSNLHSFSDFDVTNNDLPYDYSKMFNVDNDKTNPKNSSNFYYNGQVGDLGIDFNFDYMSSKNKDNSSGQENSNTFGLRNVNSLSKCNRQLVAEKLVLSYPVFGGNIDLGSEYTNTYSKETYNNTEGYIADSDIKVSENNNAIFTEYSLAINDNVEMSVGLRYEHIDFDYFVFGDKSASKTYDEFFPSFSLSAPLGDVDISLSYSGRTQRPTYYQLSSNVSYNDRYSYSCGNPMLKPSKSNDFEFQAVYQFVYFQGVYSIVKDPVLNFSKVYADDSKVKLITFENFNKITQYQLILGCQPSAGIWSATFNAGIYGQNFKVNYRGEQKKMDSPFAVIQFYNNFELPKDLVISLDLDYTGKGNYENVEIKPTFKTDFSIQKSFFNNTFDVRLAVEDIFNKSAQKLDFYNEDIFIHQTDLSETRFVSLTFKYRFNSAQSKYKGTGAGNDEKERM